MSAFREVERGQNGAVQKTQHDGAKRPKSSWRHYFLEDESIIAMDWTP
jgi:hypothetical protein